MSLSFFPAGPSGSEPPLHRAVQSGDFAEVRRLIEEEGLDPVETNRAGRIPLQVAMTAFAGDSLFNSKKSQYKQILYYLFPRSEITTVERLRSLFGSLPTVSTQLIREILVDLLGISPETAKEEAEEIVAYAQQARVRPVSPTVARYPRSGRPRTTMRRVLERTPSPLPIDRRRAFPSQGFEASATCNCLDVPTGPYIGEFYLPVVRYAPSAYEGFYGAGSEDFTWYYYEPDSDLALQAERVFVVRNKITGYITLANEYKKQLKKSKYMTKQRDLIAQLERALPSRSRATYRIFFKDEEVELESGYTNYFRNLNDNTIQEEFELHGLDSDLSTMTRDLGYQLLVMTHVVGDYSYLKTEILDVRPRDESLASVKKLPTI